MELRGRIEPFAKRLPRERLYPAVASFLDDSANRAETWLVALSGGPDSVALVFSLLAHWPGQHGRIIVAHFNHRLRGAESDEEQLFCETLSGELGLRFRSGRWAEAPAHASEKQCREVRFGFLEQLAQNEGTHVLLTGHQLNDVFETQLMRLVRGTASGGLAAPRPLRPWLGNRSIARPLLAISREELRSALDETGIPWRADSSNDSPVYARNRLRHDVVTPWVQAAGESILKGALLSRNLLEEDDRALEAWVDSLRLDFNSPCLDLAPLQGKPQAIWRRALRRWRFVGEIDRQAFENLVHVAVVGAGRVSLGPGLAEVNAGFLVWNPANEEGNVPWLSAWLDCHSTLILPSGASLEAASVDVTDETLADLRAGHFDENSRVLVCERLPLIVRSWQPGDRYQPLGATGTAKLQDMFVNRKILASLRRELPVVCQPDGRIVWVPGLPPAERSKVTSGSVTAVQLTYRAGTSTVRKQS